MHCVECKDVFWDWYMIWIASMHRDRSPFLHYSALLIILPGLRYSHSKYFARRKNLCILFMNSSFFATELYINRLYKIIFCALSFRKCGVENVKWAIRIKKDLTYKWSETPQTLRTFEFIITKDLFNADGH